MKFEHFRAMNTDELHNELERMRRGLFDLRAQSVTEKLADPSRLGQARRDIARILTIMNQRGEMNVEQRQAHMTAQATKR
jgi:large subunit ribosomal protein L29